MPPTYYHHIAFKWLPWLLAPLLTNCYVCCTERLRWSVLCPARCVGDHAEVAMSAIVRCCSKFWHESCSPLQAIQITCFHVSQNKYLFHASPSLTLCVVAGATSLTVEAPPWRAARLLPPRYGACSSSGQKWQLILLEVGFSFRQFDQIVTSIEESLI